MSLEDVKIDRVDEKSTLPEIEETIRKAGSFQYDSTIEINKIEKEERDEAVAEEEESRKVSSLESSDVPTGGKALKNSPEFTVASELATSGLGTGVQIAMNAVEFLSERADAVGNMSALKAKGKVSKNARTFDDDVKSIRRKPGVYNDKAESRQYGKASSWESGSSSMSLTEKARLAGYSFEGQKGVLKGVKASSGKMPSVEYQKSIKLARGLANKQELGYAQHQKAQTLGKIRAAAGLDMGGPANGPKPPSEDILTDTGATDTDLL